VQSIQKQDPEDLDEVGRRVAVTGDFIARKQESSLKVVLGFRPPSGVALAPHREEMLNV
jgi:hypothetical protein